jgi:hypothetical protein
MFCSEIVSLAKFPSRKYGSGVAPGDVIRSAPDGTFGAVLWGHEGKGFVVRRGWHDPAEIKGGGLSRIGPGDDRAYHLGFRLAVGTWSAQ